MNLIFMGLFENPNLNFTPLKEEENRFFGIVLFIYLFDLEERKFESVNAFEDLVYTIFCHVQVSFRYTARKSSFFSVDGL